MNRNELKDDVKLLLGHWFCALENNGANPWQMKECMKLVSKYRYTKEEYNNYLNLINK